MIGFLRGKVHSFSNNYVLLDVNGIGYRINYCHPELLKDNDEVLIYTYQSVSENDISLFGFKSLNEYDFFIKLISVKGLGPKMASNILSYVEYTTVIDAIEKEDVNYIKSLPGVGNKTANQIILDLKGKLAQDDIDDDKFKNVYEALKSLGYKQGEIKPIIKELTKENLSDQEYIKRALNLLGNK